MKQEVFVGGTDFAVINDVISLCRDLYLELPKLLTGYNYIIPHWPTNCKPAMDKELFGIARPMRSSSVYQAFQSHFNDILFESDDPLRCEDINISDICQAGFFLDRNNVKKQSKSQQWLADRLNVAELSTFVTTEAEINLFKAMVKDFYPKSNTCIEQNIKNANISRMADVWNAHLIEAISANLEYVVWNGITYPVEQLSYKEVNHMKYACKDLLKCIETASLMAPTRKIREEFRRQRSSILQVATDTPTVMSIDDIVCDSARVASPPMNGTLCDISIPQLPRLVGDFNKVPSLISTNNGKRKRTDPNCRQCNRPRNTHPKWHSITPIQMDNACPIAVYTKYRRDMHEKHRTNCDANCTHEKIKRKSQLTVFDVCEAAWLAMSNERQGSVMADIRTFYSSQQ